MGWSYTTTLSIFYLASGIFIFLLGLTILRTGRGSTPTRAAALMLFFAGVGPILSATSILLQNNLREDVVVFRSMVSNFEYLWEFYFPSLLLFALTFPRDNRFFHNFTFLGIIVFSPYLFHLITVMAGDVLPKWVVDFAKGLPLGKEVSVGERVLSLGVAGRIITLAYETLVKVHRQLFYIVNVVYAVVAFFYLYRSMKRLINPRILGQIRTVLTGLALSITSYVFAKAVPLTLQRPASQDVALALINLSLIAGGGSIAYAVIKQELLGIKYVTRKSILYGGAAMLFAILYLVIVKPVSDFFGQYSVVSKDAFETGFIILTIIAFQPLLLRIEEVLERILLKDREDVQTRFKELGGEISSATNEEELETLVRRGFGDMLDASSVRLHLETDEERSRQLIGVLEKIGEPVLRRELVKLGEKGKIGNGGPRPSPSGHFWKPSRSRGKEGRQEALELAGGSEVFVPIIKEKKCIGFLSLGEKSYGLRYTAEELGMLSVISNQISIALDNISLLRENVEKKVLEEELQIARRVQSQLLPSASPSLAGYDVCASTVPSRQVGGDYYDFAVVDGKTLILVVADVSGKGIPASLLMATLRAAVNSNEDARARPAVMMQRINTLLHGSTSAEEFATLLYGALHLESGVFRFANAGHEFPYIINGEGVTQLRQSGLVLGLMEQYHYEEYSHRIPPGGSLVLYTDGITDASSNLGEYFGVERFHRTLEGNVNLSSRDLCSTILKAVDRFAEGGHYHDDLTLVVLRRH
jgi:sigma-B regulation protein RsbU (phosphoserine phosphatase)